MESKLIICNSSPIINLSKIDRLDLLYLLFNKVIIPKAVYNELIVNSKHATGISGIKHLIGKGTIEIRSVQDQNMVKALRNDLDYGESEVIALAIEMKADLIIIDELEARKKAELFDLRKTGFIGLLIQAYNLNHIRSVIELLDLAIKKGFWINRNLYKRIIADFT